MRTAFGMLLTGALTLAAAVAPAQPPGGGKKGGRAAGPEAQAARLMAYDANKDGKLTKDELADERLHALFDKADANKDGVVTKEELLAFFTKEASAGPGGAVPPNGGPMGGRSGPMGGGRGGPMGGGRGPMAVLPQPGQVLPPFLQDVLKLTDEQKEQLAAIQKEVDAKLDKLLTAEQKAQLKEMRDRGPGGGRSGPGRGPDRP